MKSTTLKVKLLGLALAIVGMNASSQAQFIQAAKPKPQSDMWDHEVERLQFESLMIGDIADILREEFSPINFIVTGNRDGALALTLQLVNVSLDEILRALTIASEEQIQVLRHGDLVQIHQKAAHPSHLQSALFRAFPLTTYLKNADDKEEIQKRMATLERMIVESWAQFDRFRKRRRETIGSLAFHSGANVLVVFGDASEIGIAEQIIAAAQGENARAPTTSARPSMNFDYYQGSPTGLQSPYGSSSPYGGFYGGGMAPGMTTPYGGGAGGFGGAEGSMESGAGFGGMGGGAYGMGAGFGGMGGGSYGMGAGTFGETPENSGGLGTPNEAADTAPDTSRPTQSEADQLAPSPIQ